MLQRYEECARVLGKGHIFGVDKLDKWDKKHKMLIYIILTCGQTMDKWQILSNLSIGGGRFDGFDRGDRWDEGVFGWIYPRFGTLVHSFF